MNIHKVALQIALINGSSQRPSCGTKNGRVFPSSGEVEKKSRHELQLTITDQAGGRGGE
jgi:hypothetical protein